MDGNLRIVIATDSAAPSGVGEHMLTLARRLRSDYRICLVFSTAGSAPAFRDRARQEGLEARDFAGDGTALASWLAETSAAVLHVHAGIGWEGHGLAAAGWTAGIPVVRTEHLPNVMTEESDRLEHEIGLGLVDRIIFVSTSTRDSYGDVVDHKRTATIANGLDMPRPGRPGAAVRAELSIREDDRTVLTVARFTPQKGYEHLLHAARQVSERHDGLRFLLVGSGPEMAAMQALAAELDLASSVTFLGDRDDVPDLLAVTDLFVLSSLFEGLPLVVLEAMAMGLPIVATRIGGTVEALGADYPLLVEPGQPNALGSMMAQALQDPDRCRDLGERNRARFLAMFTAERMAAETAALYRAVVAERMELA